MIPTIASYQTAAKGCSTRRRLAKSLMILPIIGCALACASCSDPSTEPPYVTDTEPVGEGLKVIGYALIGAAVVVVLGRTLR